MHNWSVDTTKLEKDKDKYAVWRLEQLINFGLDGEKILESELRKNWGGLSIDPNRKKFLELLLKSDGKQNSKQ